MPADDERYEPLKTQLDNNFLMGEHTYPSNVLAAKRLMTDSVPATGVVEHTREKRCLSDVASVETKGTGDRHPICYCCWRHHP